MPVNAQCLVSHRDVGATFQGRCTSRDVGKRVAVCVLKEGEDGFLLKLIIIRGLSVIVPRRALRRRNIDHARTDVPALATFMVAHSARRALCDHEGSA